METHNCSMKCKLLELYFGDLENEGSEHYRKFLRVISLVNDSIVIQTWVWLIPEPNL